MSDQFPAEIWGRIFSLACTDDGSTGLSLALVSRYVHDVSFPVQLQSIALAGFVQVHRFADMLERRPPHLRCVRHFWFYSWETLDDDALVQAYLTSQFLGAEEMNRDEYTVAVSRVFQAVAPGLKTLLFHLSDCSNIELLNSRRYSHYCPVDISLPKHLHIVACCFYLPMFTGSVPALTHLRLSGVGLHPSGIVAGVIRAAISQPPDDGGVVARAFSHVDQIVLEPIAGFSNHHDTRKYLSRLYDDLILKDLSNKLITLRIPGKAKDDWMDRVGGGEGCWKEHYDPSDLYRRSASSG
ncbi:hypothetical protein B0H21DRAFT_757742 [Amylocystis lapponica]|nr:hypothetical protein B0H21DRAFT_757742 [Amylocystis lapponica]